MPQLQALIAVVVLLGCAYVVLQLLSMRSTLNSYERSQTAQSTAITQLSTALDKTRTQLQQHGVTPSAPPATTIVKNVPGATGAAGQSVVGPQGPAGKDGVSPDPQAIAALVATMIHPSPGPSGPPGKDSTVPGPQGVPGPASTVAGPQGAQGVPGKDSTVPGPQGAKGDPGAAGSPPSSWTWMWTDPSGTTHTYTCVPDSPGATSFHCPESGTSTPPSSPPPSPSPSPSPSTSAAALKQQSTSKSRTPSATGTGPR
ncbi:collagen-like protein [Streptacidiphilus carbonis]|uniref:collagen-like protein n=1 Tax=Streptacidiphilus carbonis TaxID=105422 RepID=UPI000A5FF068|nr:collagen-like protein [Streptacidiphilus carbonis]